MWQRGGVSTLDTPVTYRSLFAVRGFRRLGGATLVARTAAMMQALVLVLFVLQRFHSPPLAGLVVFASLVPGILLSPVAGALLDRHRRMLLIKLDYALAALALGAIAGLDAAGIDTQQRQADLLGRSVMQFGADAPQESFVEGRGLSGAAAHALV